VALSLPNPIPDNPLKWDGWKLYNSPNFYERLCLSFDSNASTEQIEDHCRQLLVWWQKKLPLKNQPSNPLSQLLRAGLDEAPIFLVEARSILLDPDTRRQHDAKLREQASAAALEEIRKLVSFAVVDGKLRPADEERLMNAGLGHGLPSADIIAAIDAELERLGARRVADDPPPPPPAPIIQTVTVPATQEAKDPFEEFRRLLRMSRLCIDGEEMTDDQRDAMCNLGESLGLTGGQAEDLIDEYLDEAAGQPMAPMAAPRPVRMAAPTPVSSMKKPAPVSSPAAVAKPAPKPAASAATAATPARQPLPVMTPLMRTQEREKFPNFVNQLGMEMYLVPSGNFHMGSAARDAQPNEQPVTLVGISRFSMSRFPVTNAQYERFDPGHASKRAPWGGDAHPVVYVSAIEAERFCEWLSRIEGRRYRLPTEAEWEYAARGTEDRVFPWGDIFDDGSLANFADARCNLAWREPRIDDGWAQTSPVGTYPKGASPFGIEDLAGNVLEWCLDGFGPYKGTDILNPRGPRVGGKRVYRGGSWKSRVSSLRTTARQFNSPEYSSNDVGFRIICECLG
jgi:formylglycine-generating enzyme required for sulfatase activity